MRRRSIPRAATATSFCFRMLGQLAKSNCCSACSIGQHALFVSSLQLVQVRARDALLESIDRLFRPAQVRSWPIERFLASRTSTSFLAACGRHRDSIRPDCRPMRVGGVNLRQQSPSCTACPYADSDLRQHAGLLRRNRDQFDQSHQNRPNAVRPPANHSRPAPHNSRAVTRADVRFMISSRQNNIFRCTASHSSCNHTYPKARRPQWTLATTVAPGRRSASRRVDVHRNQHRRPFSSSGSVVAAISIMRPVSRVPGACRPHERNVQVFRSPFARLQHVPDPLVQHASPGPTARRPGLRSSSV